MMLPGSIIVPASPWLWLAVPVFAAAVILLVWSYRRSPEIGTVHRIAFGLRLLGVLVLALCLLEPLWSGRQVKSGANLFLVIADNSSGMNVRDQGMTLSRGEILKSVFQGDSSAWLGTLADNFSLIRSFAERWTFRSYSLTAKALQSGQPCEPSPSATAAGHWPACS